MPITEHATDTHGVTLVNFALFDLLGMQLSPRIRDLGKITLYRPAPRTDYRRKISRQLNKGESIYALERGLIYTQEGALRARHLEAQTEPAWCSTLATNAVIVWTTEYYGLAVDQMRRHGRRIYADVLAHISPAHSENINFSGAIEVDIDAELAQLGPTGYRPLRSATRSSDLEILRPRPRILWPDAGT